MKHNILLWIAAGTMLASCGNNREAVEAGEAQEAAEPAAESKTFTVNAQQSTVEWEGKKLAYSHQGTIAISEGSLSMENGAVKAGKIVIDMNTIADNDLTDAEKNAKLVGHLKSPDFFDAAAHPTAVFEVTGTEGDTIRGNLTIKGITKSVGFPVKVNVQGENLTASGQFAINRSDWDVRFGSRTFFNDLIDENVVDDMISFKVNLSAAAR